MNEYTLGRAYVEGAFDIEGDMFSLLDLRAGLEDKDTVSIALKFFRDLVFASPVAVNKKAITAHYTLGDDFYLTFIDKAYRYYSHCIFEHDEDTLEQAAEHKLRNMYEALGLAPGMRLLDIGCGWGGTIDYCGARGVHVTGLTLTEHSYAYTRNLIAERGLGGCRVLLEDFLEHRPAQPYDAVVIYGVIEHIPYYRRFCNQLWSSLRPGGRFFLDASATVEKFDMGDYTRSYIWNCTHTFLCLQEFIQEMLFHGFALVDVREETRDYELTMRHWAKRFDASREAIVTGWGEQAYRAFRLYLWGGCHALANNDLQAYRLVARRLVAPGPRPGAMRRMMHAVRSLF